MATARALVQVAGLSLEHVTKLCILRDDRHESSVNSDTESPISEPLGFLRSARSMARLSLQWCVCVRVAGTLTKLDITRCPKLLDVGVVSGLTMLVELGIYECPAVTGVLIVSELPRLTHLSIDLSRATRAHLGLCVAFSSTATLRLTSRSGGMHIGLPSGLFRIRTGLKSPWQIEDCEDS